MSSDFLRNPFEPPYRSNKGTPSELPRYLLPTADVQSLTEALGEYEPSKSEPQPNLPPADISMSGKEQKEVEKESYWTRQKYIDWAESFERDKNWVDKTFEFQKDGTTIVEGDLYLLHTKIEQLPIGLMEVKGDLNVSENPFLKLNGYPKKVSGYFRCGKNNIPCPQGMPEEIVGDISFRSSHLTSLDGLPDKVMGDLTLPFNQLENLDGISKEISGDLSLTGNNQLTSLEVLRGVKIGRDLSLRDIPATEIPAGIEIRGVICLNASQTDLIADARAKGYRVKIVDW